MITVLLYGLEIAALNKMNIKSLEAVEMRALRKMAGLKWSDSETNKGSGKRAGYEIKVLDWL